MSEEKEATLTLRVIRSFQHRNIKHFVLKNVDLEITATQLMEIAAKELETRPGIPPPVRKYPYDTLKIQHKAHGAKTSDPVINTGNDDLLILKPDATLAHSGVENETEISFFKMEDYIAYKDNPQSQLKF